MSSPQPADREDTLNMEFIGPQIPSAKQNESPAYLARAMQAIREGTSIAGILRMGGAVLMVLSLSLFLMQGIEATSDLHRYLLLLGQTLLLTVAGFGVGFLLKEPRGARVFFSLALVSVPANFAVLGAMIYSIAPLDDVITQYPAYASWQSTNMKELIVASVAGLVVLVPMSVFCFAILARHSRWWLSTAYLLTSTTLLVPLRDSLSITLISSVCALAVVALLSNRHEKRQRLATREEQFAKALLFLPATLMLARSAALYNIDFHFALAVIMAVYYLLRRIVVSCSGSTVLTTLLQSMTAACAFVLAFMLTTLIDRNVAFDAPVLVFILIWLALNVDLARSIDSSAVRSAVHGLWALASFTAIIFDALFFDSANGLVINLIIAAVLLAASTFTRQRLGAVLGTVALIGLLIINSTQLFVAVLDTGWAGMAIAGASTIVAGSLLERYWPIMKIQLANRFDAKKAGITHTGTLEPQQDITSESYDVGQLHDKAA
ncbi:MAG: hypothetical protein AB8B64_26960 [Granulosicoccus sp.]